MQVSWCQLLLEVELVGLSNPRSAETREDEVEGIIECCCNTNVMPMTCASSAGQPVEGCSQSCDIFFNVELSDCAQPANCLISTADGTIYGNGGVLSYGYIFSFVLNEIPQDVSQLPKCQAEKQLSSNLKF